MKRSDTWQRYCRCGLKAVVMKPGQEAVRQAGVLLQRPVADRYQCLYHAGLTTRVAARVYEAETHGPRTSYRSSSPLVR